MTKARIQPRELHGSIVAPPSKSYTHRTVLLALLSKGRSRIQRPLLAADTMATIEGCRALGAEVRLMDSACEVRPPDFLHVPDDVIDAGNSGTTLRLLTGAASLVPDGSTVLTGDASLRRRPLQPLLDALGQLGAECWSTRGNGCAPVVVRGSGLRGGNCVLPGHISSQFISGVLIAAAQARRTVRVKVTGQRVSRPYVDATIATIQRFGGEVEAGDNVYTVPGAQILRGTRFEVPGDFAMAGLLAAAAVLSRGQVTITGLATELPEPDAELVTHLRAVGVEVAWEPEAGSLRVTAGAPVKGGRIDLTNAPDLLPPLAILALRAVHPVEIRGVAHARLKESDRLATMATELRKLGCRVAELSDGLRIESSSLAQQAALDAHGDHRLCAALCAASLALPGGATVEGIESLQIAYADFLRDLTALGARVEVVA